MWHSGRALLPCGEWLFRFPHFSPLKMTDLSRKFVEGAPNYRNRAKVFRVAIALKRLGGRRSRLQPHPLADSRFHIRIKVGKRANGAR